MQVLIENSSVQQVFTERASHEKCAPTPQESSYDGQVQIFTGGDMGWCESIVIEHIGKQQVVNMTPVTWDVDDLVSTANASKGIDMMDIDAIVDVVPQPA